MLRHSDKDGQRGARRNRLGLALVILVAFSPIVVAFPPWQDDWNLPGLEEPAQLTSYEEGAFSATAESHYRAGIASATAPCRDCAGHSAAASHFRSAWNAGMTTPDCLYRFGRSVSLLDGGNPTSFGDPDQIMPKARMAAHVVGDVTSELNALWYEFLQADSREGWGKRCTELICEQGVDLGVLSAEALDSIGERLLTMTNEPQERLKLLTEILRAQEAGESYYRTLIYMSDAFSKAGNPMAAAACANVVHRLGPESLRVIALSRLCELARAAPQLSALLDYTSQHIETGDEYANHPAARSARRWAIAAHTWLGSATDELQALVRAATDEELVRVAQDSLPKYLVTVLPYERGKKYGMMLADEFMFLLPEDARPEILRTLAEHLTAAGYSAEAAQLQEKWGR